MRSTLATDEFGRSVVIEELRADADEALKWSFQAAIQVMSEADSTALPRVLRSSPTMFVREYVTGASTAASLDKVNECELVGLRALCEVVLGIHARGMVHRGIRPDALVVQRSVGRCALVAVDWRGLMPTSRARDTVPLFALDQRAPDTAVVLEVACALVARNGDLAWLGREIAIGRAKPGDAVLHQLWWSIGRYVERVACCACGVSIRLGTATMVGNGYVCGACPAMERAVERNDIDEIDLHLTGDEQLALMTFHRRVHIRRMIALFLARLGWALAAGLLSLLLWRWLDTMVLAALLIGDVIIQPVWLTMTSGMLYHRARAKYYRKKLRRSATAGEVTLHLISVTVVVAQLLILLPSHGLSKPKEIVVFALRIIAWLSFYWGDRGVLNDALVESVRLSRHARGAAAAAR